MQNLIRILNNTTQQQLAYLQQADKIQPCLNKHFQQKDDLSMRIDKHSTHTTYIKQSFDKNGSKIFEAEGYRVEEDNFGCVSGLLTGVRTISIGDITSVKIHQIERSNGLVSHFITFTNGGSCALTYNTRGEVINFTIGKVQLTRTDDGVLIINTLPI
ncbi:hypothetical protein [Methylobacterium sp. GXS13]|uniref:hypothetical protein n=1 Tax=Methylobacterium sp. GXS13 TaxID=1730094 RepID=UPI00128F02A8|nr:hypothetical protein [Methylobacterium sp. GXS13]